jgi:hypothetical protein
MNGHDEIYKEEDHTWRRHSRPSLFFPVILITLGVVFLLRNTGVLPGDIWQTLLRLWPVLLIAIGVDSLFQRHGIVGPIFWMTLGGVLLLANLGYLPFDVWSVLLNLWPLLLIAIGLDIVIGRRSLVAAILAAIMLTALLAGALWYLVAGSPLASDPGGTQISYPLSGANRAEVSLRPTAGSLKVGSLEAGDQLVEGTVVVGRNERLVSGPEPGNSVEVAQFTLESEGAGRFLPPQRTRGPNWELGLSREVPLDLTVNMGAGDINLDLSNLTITNLRVSLGVGRITVYAPFEHGLSAEISSGVGETYLIVPSGAAVRIQADTALAVRDIPENYQRQDHIYTSPAYTTGAEAILIQVNQAIGRVIVIER